MSKSRKTVLVAPDETPQWKGPLLTTFEVSAITRLSRQTLSEQRLKGTGCGYIRNGSRVFYYSDQLHAYLAAKHRNSTSDRTA